MSLRLMFWAYVAAVAFTTYNIGKYVVGPGKWSDR